MGARWASVVAILGTSSGGLAQTLPPPPDLPAKYTGVAILPLESIQVSESLAEGVKSSLLSEIDEAPGFQAVSPRDVVNEVQPLGLSLDCGNDVTCIARLGRYARAHLALATRVAAIGGTLNVSLQLVDTQEERELLRLAEILSFDPAERATALHRLAVQLLRPKTYVGTLNVQCSIDGADVYLDDRLVGTTPLPAPLAQLRAGTHILRVHKDGYSDMYRFVDVTYKRTTTLNVDLETTTMEGVVDLETSEVALLYVTSDVPGIEVRVDGEPIARTILDGPVEVPAGFQRVSLRYDGSDPVASELTVGEGQRAEVAVVVDRGDLKIIEQKVVPATHPLLNVYDLLRAATAATATAVEAPPPRPRQWTWRFYTGVAVAGGGVVALGLTGWLSSRVRSLGDEARTLEDEYALAATTRARKAELVVAADDVNADGQIFEVAQWLTLAGGVVLVAAGGALLGWEILAEPEAVSTVAVTPTEGGARLDLGFSF